MHVFINLKIPRHSIMYHGALKVCEETNKKGSEMLSCVVNLISITWYDYTVFQNISCLKVH